MGPFHKSTAFSEEHRVVVWMEAGVRDAQEAAFYGEMLYEAYPYQGESSPVVCSCS